MAGSTRETGHFFVGETTVKMYGGFRLGEVARLQMQAAASHHAIQKRMKAAILLGPATYYMYAGLCRLWPDSRPGAGKTRHRGGL